MLPRRCRRGVEVVEDDAGVCRRGREDAGAGVGNGRIQHQARATRHGLGHPLSLDQPSDAVAGHGHVAAVVGLGEAPVLQIPSPSRRDEPGIQGVGQIPGADFLDRGTAKGGGAIGLIGQIHGRLQAARHAWVGGFDPHDVDVALDGHLTGGVGAGHAGYGDRDEVASPRVGGVGGDGGRGRHREKREQGGEPGGSPCVTADRESGG